MIRLLLFKADFTAADLDVYKRQMYHLFKEPAAFPFTDMRRGSKLIQRKFLPVMFVEKVKQHSCTLLLLYAVAVSYTHLP